MLSSSSCFQAGGNTADNVSCFTVTSTALLIATGPASRITPETKRQHTLPRRSKGWHLIRHFCLFRKNRCFRHGTSTKFTMQCDAFSDLRVQHLMAAVLVNADEPLTVWPSLPRSPMFFSTSIPVFFSTKEHQVEGGLFLDVVVRQSTPILQLYHQRLLLCWDPFHVLNFGLNVANAFASFDIKGNGLTSQSFHEDLHGFAKFWSRCYT